MRFEIRETFGASDFVEVFRYDDRAYESAIFAARVGRRRARPCAELGIHVAVEEVGVCERVSTHRYRAVVDEAVVGRPHLFVFDDVSHELQIDRELHVPACKAGILANCHHRAELRDRRLCKRERREAVAVVDERIAVRDENLFGEIRWRERRSKRAGGAVGRGLVREGRARLRAPSALSKVVGDLGRTAARCRAEDELVEAGVRKSLELPLDERSTAYGDERLHAPSHARAETAAKDYRLHWASLSSRATGSSCRPKMWMPARHDGFRSMCSRASRSRSKRMLNDPSRTLSVFSTSVPPFPSSTASISTS